jgi:NADH:ubiquinone oxidoreductase subunit 5 (subunit L)/multisubunit Na+/H+ antiporter MnhA subunit
LAQITQEELDRQTQIKIAIHTTKANTYSNAVLAFFSVIPLAAFFAIERITSNSFNWSDLRVSIFMICLIVALFVCVVICNKLADKEITKLNDLLDPDKQIKQAKKTSQ